jgi:hypothetical protein
MSADSDALDLERSSRMARCGVDRLCLSMPPFPPFPTFVHCLSAPGGGVRLQPHGICDISMENLQWRTTGHDRRSSGNSYPDVPFLLAASPPKIGSGQPLSTQQAREAQVDPSHSSIASALGELLILSIAYFLPSCASSSAKSLQQDVQILCFPSSNFHFASIPLRTVWHH